MTGLPNARSLFLHLDSELARSKRLQTPLAVVVCDLDGFKQVNDRFGHLVGNMVLRSVASGLKETCREYDYVARMGGDEFVVIMPGFDAAAMKEKSLLFQSIAMEAGVQVCKEPLLSLSVGRSHVPARRSRMQSNCLPKPITGCMSTSNVITRKWSRPSGHLQVNLRPTAIN